MCYKKRFIAYVEASTFFLLLVNPKMTKGRDCVLVHLGNF